jgi:hypothetical protein
MVGCLAKELSRQDGISIEESRNIVKRWMWYFWAKGMKDRYREQAIEEIKAGARPAPVSRRLRRRVRELPGFEGTRQKIRRIAGGEISLRVLLHPNFRFYGDFMPIYRAVTVPPPSLKETLDRVKA